MTQNPKFKKNGGFTLVELMIVIAIIGILSQIVLVSLSVARSKARDAQRKNDLHVIATALEMYYNDFGTYLVDNTGWYSGGQGWLAYENGATYPKSVTARLFELGLLTQRTIEDPKQSPGYMIYLCGNDFAISATLENPTPADTTHAESTCNGTGINGTVNLYGKNYAISNIK